MPYFVDYEPETGKIVSFYHDGRHKNIPPTAIEITEGQYLQAAFNQKNSRVNPETKTLEFNQQ